MAQRGKFQQYANKLDKVDATGMQKPNNRRKVICGLRLLVRAFELKK